MARFSIYCGAHGPRAAAKRGVPSLAVGCTPAAPPAASYAWLRHAEWDGLTASDRLFPTFLVSSGLSLSFLLRDRSDPPGQLAPATCYRLTRRLVLLIAAGLVYNAYGASWLDLSELRLTGALQMIGIAGAAAAAVILVGRAFGGGQKIWWLVATATTITLLYGVGRPAPWTWPFIALGRNALIVFLAERFLLQTAGHVYSGGRSL